MSQNIIHNADCLTGMRDMQDDAYGLLEADPPYFSGPDKRKYYGSKVSSLNIRRTDYPRTSSWQLPTAEWFQEVQRVTQHQIIWGANYFDFIGTPHKTPEPHELQAWLDAHPRGWIVWDKVKSESTFANYELAWTSFDRPTTVFTFMWNGMNQGKSVTEGHIMQGNKKLNERRIHQTQKPVPLYKWEFSEFCWPGCSILSTHVGSGSARIAAWELNIPFTGFELDPVHHSNQDARFSMHQSQQRLFL